MSLKTEHLQFAYGEQEVLRDISFQVNLGQLTAVIGPNGVGKSTLFRCILGILSGFSGKISVFGDDIRSLPRRELAGRIAYIPQVHQPTFGYSVLDTVLMGTTRYLSPFEQPKAFHIEKAFDALKQVGMADFAENNYAQLSGGQQQLVLIARALAQDAKILVMDEPTSALDFGNQINVMKMVRNLSHKGYLILVSTHNPQHAFTFADQVLVLMPDGSYSFGPASEVMNEELMKKLYGMDVEFLQHEDSTVLVPRYREEKYHV